MGGRRLVWCMRAPRRANRSPARVLRGAAAELQRDVARCLPARVCTSVPESTRGTRVGTTHGGKSIHTCCRSQWVCGCAVVRLTILPVRSADGIRPLGVSVTIQLVPAVAAALLVYLALRGLRFGARLALPLDSAAWQLHFAITERGLEQPPLQCVVH